MVDAGGTGGWTLGLFWLYDERRYSGARALALLARCIDGRVVMTSV